MKIQVLGWVAGAVLAFGLASSAGAMDLDKVKAHQEPDIASDQAAQVCAASMMGAAYLAEKGSDDAELYTTLARAWVSLAVKTTTRTSDDYIDNVLMSDMQALYDAGDDTVTFYKLYCLKASKTLLS